MNLSGRRQPRASFNGYKTTLPARLMLASLVVGLLGWAMFFAVFRGEPGQDFVVFHTAAAVLRSGHMDMLLEPQEFTDLLNATHKTWLAAPIKMHPWVYPPVTLLLALPFGYFTYPWALALFLAVTGAAMLAGLWAWAANLRERALLILGVLLCPATGFNLGAGQLGFFIAAVVLGAMYFLQRRPLFSGALFSLLCLKPQFVPLIPIALLAGRHYAAIAGGLAGGIALIIASVAAAGAGAWTDWIALATGANPALGSLVHAVRIYDQSIDTCLQTLGAGPRLAEAGQFAAMAGSALCVWKVFSSDATSVSRLAVLLCAMTLAAPHVGDYDEIMPAIAALLLLRKAPWRACGTWLATAFNPPALIAVLGLPVLTDISALTPLLTASLMIVSFRNRNFM